MDLVAGIFNILSSAPLGVSNIVLSAAVILFSVKIYGDLKHTSLSKPLVLIAFAFFLLSVHQAIETITDITMVDSLGNAEHSVASMFFEMGFAVAIFFGVIGFKTQFEKFEWVREITQGQAELVKKT